MFAVPEDLGEHTNGATSIPSSFLRSEGKGRLIVGGELLERERVFKKLDAETPCLT
jgi:hypothetical protein